MNEAGFSVHKFVSSDSNLTDKVQSTSASCVKPESAESAHDVLGVRWNYESDEIVVDLSAIVDEIVVPTKRIVLRIIARIYDPLGLCSPVVLRGKMIFQEFCRRDLGWDGNAPDDLAIEWFAW